MLSQDQETLNLIKDQKKVVQSNCQQPIQCFYKNAAQQFCSNQKCIQKCIFTCRQEKCLCQQQHKMCQKRDIIRSFQTINSKISKTKDIKQYSMRNNCKANLSQGTKQILQNYQDVCKQNILKVNKDIEELIKKQEFFPIKISSQIQIQKEKSEIHSKFQLNRDLLMFDKSDQLNSFFSPKKVKRLKLLYKASQYKFSLQKYYQFCGLAQNTIIIALTSKGKIFGGFTPFCLWSGKDEWMKDDKKQTFLFSLSQNQKISLNETKCAVCRFASKNNRIQFGGDFYISDKANIYSSWVGNCYYYLNSKYKQDKQSYLKLNGEQSGQCLLQEWEVYGLQFEQRSND